MQLDPLIVLIAILELVSLALAHYALRPAVGHVKREPPLVVRYIIGTGSIVVWFTALQALRAWLYGPTQNVWQGVIDLWVITAAGALATVGPRIIDRLLHPDWYAKNDSENVQEDIKRIRQLAQEVTNRG